jgi:hypothetical protein
MCAPVGMTNVNQPSIGHRRETIRRLGNFLSLATNKSERNRLMIQLRIFNTHGKEAFSRQNE